MSERNLSLLLLDIEQAIEAILDYTRGFTFEDFEADAKTRHAVERNFEIIGEAATRVSASFKGVNSHIEWRILKDFRNFIIHDYFGINNEIVWDTIQLRLPDLLTEVRLLKK
ncbi:HepT-like ribonuclease domain-containing protein [Parapedobacter sp. DT-150]|uniref:HepT-like ribonuclease domain-containing protein n=1 Tax=Parapedobacter sp. DT-150 TaxID=3396162 RepID=UPI003F1A35CB